MGFGSGAFNTRQILTEVILGSSRAGPRSSEFKQRKQFTSLRGKRSSVSGEIAGEWREMELVRIFAAGHHPV